MSSIWTTRCSVKFVCSFCPAVDTWNASRLDESPFAVAVAMMEKLPGARLSRLNPPLEFVVVVAMEPVALETVTSAPATGAPATVSVRPLTLDGVSPSVWLTNFPRARENAPGCVRVVRPGGDDGEIIDPRRNVPEHERATRVGRRVAGG